VLGRRWPRRDEIQSIFAADQTTVKSTTSGRNSSFPVRCVSSRRERRAAGQLIAIADTRSTRPLVNECAGNYRQSNERQTEVGSGCCCCCSSVAPSSVGDKTHAATKRRTGSSAERIVLIPTNYAEAGRSFDGLGKSCRRPAAVAVPPRLFSITIARPCVHRIPTCPADSAARRTNNRLFSDGFTVRKHRTITT